MTNDEGQMRNRWGSLKISRRWVIVLTAVAIGLLLTYALFSKPAVSLEVVKVETQSLYWLRPVEDGVKNRAYDRVVGTLELRNNTAKPIQVPQLFPEVLPSFICAHWDNGRWHHDNGRSAALMQKGRQLPLWSERPESFFAFQPTTSADWWVHMAGDVPIGVKWWSRVAVAPGETIRFSAALLEKNKPSTVMVPFRTPQPMLRHLSFLPDAVTQHLPWLFEQHVIKSEILLNGTETRPTLPSGGFDREIWDGYKPRKKK